MLISFTSLFTTLVQFLYGPSRVANPRSEYSTYTLGTLQNTGSECSTGGLLLKLFELYSTLLVTHTHHSVVPAVYSAGNSLVTEHPHGV